MTARWQRVASTPGFRVSCAVIAALFVLAIAAPWIAPYDPAQILDPVALRSRYPSWQHPMGTDPYGRDLLSRMLVGARTSLLLALLAVTLSTIAGTLVGVVSGYAGGAVDRVLMRLTDTVLAVPRVLLLLTIVGLWGAPGLPLLAIVLASTGWMTTGRLVRGEVRVMRENDRIAAARAIGQRHTAIVWRHVLPDVVPLIAVTATFAFGQVLLLESGLSYLGIGVHAPMASWGTILLDVSDVVGPARWLAIGPGLVLVLTVVAIHRIGDALQTLGDDHRDRIAA